MKTQVISLRLVLLSLIITFGSCASPEDNENESSFNNLIQYTPDLIPDDVTNVNPDDIIEVGGLTYRKSTQNVTINICSNFYCSVQELFFFDDYIGYAVTLVDVYKTIDGGENWELIINQDIVGRWIPLNEELIFLNTYGGILKTTNSGNSWSSISRPLEFICAETQFINPGIIHFVNESSGFIQDRCYKGDLFKTTDSGATWEQIYTSNDEISEYYFEDENNGFIIVNDVIYVTDNAGVDWLETTILPSNFDYVIEKENLFLFPEGSTSVNKPNLDFSNVSIVKYDVNDNGDIAIILKDESLQENNWSLMLNLNDADNNWLFIDQLNDIEDNLPGYSSIHLTNGRTMYIGEYHSGEIFKYDSQ